MLISVLNAVINWLRLSRERNNIVGKQPQALIVDVDNLPAPPESRLPQKISFFLTSSKFPPFF
jgi:hypothetical protein